MLSLTLYLYKYKGKADSLGENVLEALMKIIPSRDEEIKLKEYKENPSLKLGPEESFLKAVISIPYAFKRIVALLYISNFDSEVNYLNDLFRTLKVSLFLLIHIKFIFLNYLN